MRAFEKTAIVTVAASQAGAAMARLLLEAGAACVGLLDRDGLALETLADSLASEYGESRILALPTDLLDATQVRHSFREFVRHTGRLDLIIENPAGVIDRTMSELVTRGIARHTGDRWLQVIEKSWTDAANNVRRAIGEDLRRLGAALCEPPVTVKCASRSCISGDRDTAHIPAA